MTIMPRPVRTIPQIGVSNLLIFKKEPLINPSRLIAIGYRAADSIPAFAADAKAARAAAITNPAPTAGMYDSAAVCSGAKSP